MKYHLLRNICISGALLACISYFVGCTCECETCCPGEGGQVCVDISSQVKKAECESLNDLTNKPEGCEYHCKPGK